MASPQPKIVIGTQTQCKGRAAMAVVILCKIVIKKLNKICLEVFPLSHIPN